MPRRCSTRSTAIRSAAPSRSPAARWRCSMSTSWPAQAKLAPDGEIDLRIKDAIARLLARQGSNGSFGLWSVGGDDAWLDSYVTDFLTRAKERGFEIPATAFTLALDRLRNYVATAPEPWPKTAAASSPMRSMCWRAMPRPRSATCATSPMRSWPRWRRRSARRRSARRSPCSATRRVPTGSISRRSTRSRRSPSSISAAPISARRCAMQRRW